MPYNSDYQDILITEAGTFFKTALWKEFLKKLAAKRKGLVDQLETIQLSEQGKVYNFVRIQGQLNGIDESLWTLESIIGLGSLPLVTKADFPRLT